MKDKVDFSDLYKVSGGLSFNIESENIDNTKTITFINSGNTVNVTVSNDILDAYMNGDPLAKLKLETLMRLASIANAGQDKK